MSCISGCFIHKTKSILCGCEDLGTTLEAAIWLKTQTCYSEAGTLQQQQRERVKVVAVCGGGEVRRRRGSQEAGRPGPRTPPYSAPPPAAELSSACAAGMRLDHSAGVVWGEQH